MNIKNKNCDCKRKYNGCSNTIVTVKINMIVVDKINIENVPVCLIIFVQLLNTIACKFINCVRNCFAFTGFCLDPFLYNGL